MRLPIAEYGKKEILLFGGGASLGIVLSTIFFWPAAVVFILALFFVLFFFRDPERKIPSGDRILVSPADGVVVEIAEVEEPQYIGGDAIRIGIFMTLLSAHVNRAPCGGVVEKIQHTPGGKLSALDERSRDQNENNIIGVYSDVPLKRRVLVKQIAGKIAQRIVCTCNVGDKVEKGQKIGMIKFGSRTEVYVPKDGRFRIFVEKNQWVKAGETIIGEME